MVEPQPWKATKIVDSPCWGVGRPRSGQIAIGMSKATAKRIAKLLNEHGLMPTNASAPEIEQPRAATVDVDPQDAAASLGELSLPAMDRAGLPVTSPQVGRQP